MSAMTIQISRRKFITIAAGTGAGLILGLEMPMGGSAARAASPFMPNPFVRIAPDSTVTVLVKHLDKGQGIATGLSTLVAEELDADWAQMRAEFAPADASKYNNLLFGPVQGTGGSTSMANSFEQYRKAGATARAMLVNAAAKAWNVAPGEITVAAGKISHGSGKSAAFGEFAEAAAQLEVPSDVVLKDEARFAYIGKSFPRLDTEGKITGAPLYTQDIHLDGMVTAAIIHPPRFGGKAKSIDASAAKAVKGFLDAKILPQGVAVYATSTWPAFKAREAVKVEWDESAAEKRGTAELLEEYRKLAGTPGVKVRSDGNAEAELAKAAHVVEADFTFPFLAHAAMEPMNAVVQSGGTSVGIWTGAQLPTVDQNVVASIFGVKPEAVMIETKFAGGSFGRRAVPNSDYIAEAASVAKEWGKPDPVKLVWSREDDTRAGYYRPLYLHRVKAGLDKDGNLIAWHHRIVGQSILTGTLFESFLVKDGVDATSVEGVSDMPYAIPNFHAELHSVKVGVPVLWWRSVGHTHTAYVVETMLDQLAAKAGKDPVEFRMALLKDKPRHQGVLKLAAEKAEWGKPLPEGQFRGIAVHESFASFVAEVAEISLDKSGAAKVTRVVCAVDCGIAVNPDQVKSQMEGGIGFGLGAAMRNAITLTGGVVDQGNFDGYEPIRMSDMPKVEVHILASTAPPTGVGEPGVPPVAPAVANAVFKATGRLLNDLPLQLDKAGANI
jgi:isoquinoline 1-oxidoreductase beta subunit